MRKDNMPGHRATLIDRAEEISDFLGLKVEDAVARLSLGFVENHHFVAEDFRKANPQNDDALLTWYRNTEAYIWELSAYHLDPGFNYAGMVDGIAQAFEGSQRLLCLGDGIGDLTCGLYSAGHTSFYHDLAGSQTALFATKRIPIDISYSLSIDWNPPHAIPSVNGIIALDFLEHVTEVEKWAEWIYETLPSGGQFMYQNAFGIGDDEHEGSIPMHLVRNNRFVTDWEPLLDSIGFIKGRAGGWRTKP